MRATGRNHLRKHRHGSSSSSRRRPRRAARGRRRLPTVTRRSPGDWPGPQLDGSAPRRPADGDGYGDSDGFRGSAADPVHMYLKEIGKVKLLDAALEVELAERILAGNEAAERLAGARGRPRRELSRSGRRTGCWSAGGRRPRRR